MELDELIEEVTSAADKSAELRKRDLSLQKEYEEVCEQNCKKIVMPYIDKMNGIVASIKSKADVYVDSKCLEVFKTDDSYFELNTTSFGVSPRLVSRNGGCWNDLIFSSDLPYRRWRSTGGLFLTEEGCYKFIDAMAEAYCDVLGRFRSVIANKNERLASSIQKLEDALKKSSAPKENDDGTVEFHINGKTYVGTVKEE